jgi:hypothetical protein
MTRARAVALGLAALTLGALASLAPAAPAVPMCAAAGAHHAAVVVEHGDGSVATRCVAFDASDVTGEQLLTQSGIAWSGQTFGGFGDAVCALDGEPARYLDCPGKDNYWAVFVSSGGGAWRLSNVGISSLTLRDGDAEGFRYVPAAGDPVAPASPAGVCPAPVAATSGAVSAVPPRVTVSPGSLGSPSIEGSPSPDSTPSQTLARPSETPPTSTERIAVVAATATVAVPAGSDPPRTPPPSGPDTGLLAASVAGGGLAGFALLRLVVRRRRLR